MFNGLQFGQNLLLSRWVDRLEADANDTPAMWQYIAISFAVIMAVVCRQVYTVVIYLRTMTMLFAFENPVTRCFGDAFFCRSNSLFFVTLFPVDVVFES